MVYLAEIDTNNTTKSIVECINECVQSIYNPENYLLYGQVSEKMFEKIAEDSYYNLPNTDEVSKKLYMNAMSEYSHIVILDVLITKNSFFSDGIIWISISKTKGKK